jgi:phosphocarrier protein HPr
VEVTITDKAGLHARPAARFVQTAAKFKSRVTLVGNGVTVDAKSILGVLSLGAGQGSRVAVEATGEDEAQAVAALKTLLESGFAEE